MSAELISLADGDQEALDDYMVEIGWSDGLPVVAPTPARVEAMIAATDRPAGHELGTMPPRQGVVTIESVAVNAVMAGCRPKHFALVVTAVESPWEPLHVELGFDAENSTVTVVGCENPHNINDHVSIGEDGILATVAGSLANMGSNNAYLHGGPVLAFGPEHAAIVGAAGLGKDDVRRRVFDEARVPRVIWERGGMAKMAEDPFADEAMVPIIRQPEDLLVIVVGGFGRHSSWLPTFGGSTRAVTRAVTDIGGNPVGSVRDLGTVPGST
jgi:hypothetical protein